MLAVCVGEMCPKMNRRDWEVLAQEKENGCTKSTQDSREKT